MIETKHLLDGKAFKVILLGEYVVIFRSALGEPTGCVPPILLAAFPGTRT